MPKLKLQYFGHLMWRADSLEKILMLGKIEGKRRRGQEKMTIEWHHQYNVQELMQTLGDGKGQGGLACCSPWGHEESEHALATEPQGSSMRQSRQQDKDENNKGGHYITIKGSIDQEDVLCCILSCFSCVWLCGTLWTIACQAPLSTGFSRQEYWSGLPYPSPGDLPKPGIEPGSLMSPALAGRFFTTSATW